MGQDRDAKPQREHDRRQHDDRTDVVHGADECIVHVARTRSAFLELEAVQKVDRAVDGEREGNRDRNDRGELQPFPAEP